jgi:hypothetical protein
MPIGNDIDSQLPVRSVDDVDERVLVKIQDGDSPAGANNTVTVSEKKAHVRNHGADSDGTDKQVLLSQEGHTQSNGDYDGSTNKRPSSQGAILHDRKDTAQVPAEADQNKRPTAVSYDNGVDETVVSADVAIRDEEGVPFSASNPLPVSIEDSVGDEVHDHNESASAITKNNSDNHEYTVTALKELELEQWGCGGSGYMKGELQIETGVATGVFTSADVLFNSTALPSPDRVIKRAIKVAAGVKVRIIRTALDNQSQALYSFVNGFES